jgi:hypothetical protein
VVNGPRHELFADAALPRDQHRRLEVGDLRDSLEHGLHLARLGGELLEAGLLADLLLEGAVLAAERLALLRLLQGEEQLLGLEGLGDVVVGPRFDCFDRQVQASVGAHDDDGDLGALGFQGREQVEAAHLGHAHIGEHEVGSERLEQAQRLLAVGGGLDLVPVTAQEGAHDKAQVLFIVDYQDTAHRSFFLHPRD